MLFVKELTESEKITLENMQFYHPVAIVRKRSYSILLSSEGYSIPNIIKKIGICRQSLSRWLKAWENGGIVGLLEKPKSGRPRKLSVQQEEYAIEKVKENPRNLKNVLAELSKETGISISKETLKRICKRANLRWKRVTLKNNRNQREYERVGKIIEELLREERQGKLEVYYFDESGFNLQPCVPYAWQGKHIEIPASHSKSLNVLGFINHNCQFESFVFEGSINTDVVIACFDEFAKLIDKPTYVIIDNAPTHTSELFLAQLHEWEELGLYVVPIPSYSPQLNIIDMAKN